MIVTERLELIPATPELTQAALTGNDALAAALGVTVPSTWPPELLDDDALHWTLDLLAENPANSEWSLHFVVLVGDNDQRTLIGSAGYAGPPADHTVEVGYGIVSDHQRKGFATEATRGLIEHAFENPDVQRIIVQTLPGLTASIGVIDKFGFRFIGEGSEPGVIRYELTRSTS